ncbi:MAG: peptidylprolyl isomerase [bacterium]|nr:peptidylprolyl isomerase [bacterium]
MLERLLLVLMCSFAVNTAAHAAAQYDLRKPGLAAIINDAPLSLRLVAVMQKIAAGREPGISKAAVLHALLEDRLIAAHARASFPADELIENNKVGYTPAVQLEQALVADLQAAFGDRISQSVEQKKGGNLDTLVRSRHELAAADWIAVFGARPGMLLEYALSEQGRAAAAKIDVLTYRLGKRPAVKVSLLDVYDAQNVQGRHQLHDHDAAFAMQQAELLLERQYVLYWAQSRSGLSAPEYAVLKQIVADRLVTEGWLATIGVANDIHADNAHLKALAAAASAEEIRHYYDLNRDQFLRVEKVHARHISLADEAAADAVYARLEKGEGFAALARSNSLAGDREQGGDLGWLLHGDKAASWMESLAFVQKPQVPSRPFRSPGKPGENPAWEILLVDERVEGYQPADSESVRYVAANAIAKIKVQEEYRETREHLWREADIHIAPALQPEVKPVATPVLHPGKGPLL